MLWCLRNDFTRGVVSGTPGTTRDLMELACGELAHLDTVVLREAGEQDGADGHVDSDTESVGSTDHPQQPTLRELLDQTPIFGQHARVVHPDTRTNQARERCTESRGEAEAADLLGDRISLLARGDFGTRQRLRALDGGRLRKVHDVDRGEPIAQQLLHRVVHRRHHVPVVEWNRTGDTGHLRHLAAGAALQIGRELGDVAEGCRHQQELRAGKKQQRDLPCPSALGVGVVVELVHDHDIRRSIRPLSQRDVGQDLGCTADDQRIRVHTGVTGDHADVGRAKGLDQLEELLADQRLDRRRVPAALALREGDRVGGERHERLAGAGRRREHQVLGEHQLEHRLLLSRVEPDALLPRPLIEGANEAIRVEGLPRARIREPVGEHRASLPYRRR